MLGIVLVLASVLSSQDDAARIGPGERFLEHGGAEPVVVELAPDAEGSWTLSCETYAFQAELALMGEDGVEIGSDRDERVPSRPFLELATGPRPARVEVRSLDGRAGSFLLVLHPRTAGADRLLREAELEYRTGGFERARGLAAEARRLAKTAGDERALANARVIEAVALQPLGRLDEASDLLDEALALYEERGDLRKQLVVLGNLASIAQRRGQGDLAYELRTREVAAARELGDRRQEGSALANFGELLRAGNAYDEARLVLEEALDIFEELEDEGRECVARIQLANTLLSLNEPGAAQSQAERAVDLARDLDAPGELGNALFALGGVLRDRGQLREARDAFEESMELFESIGHQVSRIWALGYYAQLHQFLGEFTAASEAYRKRIELNAESLDNPYTEAWSIVGLGEIEVRVGDLQRAVELLEEARDAGLRLKDSFLEAQALQGLSHASLTLGRPTDAREQLARALALHEARGGTVQVADCELAFADLCLVRQDWSEAERHLERAFELFEGLGHARGLAHCAVKRARLLRQEGWHDEARALLHEELWSAREREDRLVETIVELELGRIAHDLGDFPAALEFFRGGYDTSRRTGNRIDQGRYLHALADMALHLGDYEQVLRYGDLGLDLAEDLGRPALELDMRLVRASALTNLNRLEEAGGEASRSYELSRSLDKLALKSRSLAALGRLEAVSGNDERALEIYRERADLIEERARPVEQAAALSSVAYMLLEMGRPEEAVEWADRAIASLPDRVADCWLLNPLWTRARARLVLGEHDLAREDLARGELALGKPSLRDLPRGLATTRRGRFAHWGELAQDVVAAQHASAGSDEERAAIVAYGFQQSARWKGRALLEGILEHRIGGRTAEINQLRRRRRLELLRRDDLLNLLSDEIAGGSGSARVAELRRGLAEAESRIADLDRELEARGPRESLLEHPANLDVERARRLLARDGQVLVDFARGTESLNAYVLAPEGLSLVELGAWAPIERAVDDFLAGIRDAASLASVPELAARGGRLHELLLAPVLAALEEPPARLLVVPAAELAQLPFGALVADSAEAPSSLDDVKFVLDRTRTSYAPSAPVAVELAEIGPREESGRVLILADPYYVSEGPGGATRPDSEEPPALPSLLGGAVASRAVPSAAALTRLEGTREEALLLSRFLLRVGGGDEAALLDLEAERSGSLSAPLFDLHLGVAASPRRLDEDLRGFSILHLAAHGYIDPEQADRTGIALAHSEEDAGYFTIADALELDLDANLVVLSACETARGHVQAGEGVQSLARGFLHAGARGVIATLWPVSDEATADVMGRFYASALESGLPVSEALAEARRALREGAGSRGVALGAGGAPLPQGFRHPYYWAPFIHVGR